MKKFQFKLESLLTYRKYLERLAQQDTAKAQMDVKSCEAVIRQLEMAFSQQSDQIENILSKGMAASEFRRFHDYLDGVENQIEDEKKRHIRLRELLKEKVERLKKKVLIKRQWNFIVTDKRQYILRKWSNWSKKNLMRFLH